MRLKLKLISVVPDGWVKETKDKTSDAILEDINFEELLGDDLYARFGDLRISSYASDFASINIVVGGRKYFILYINDNVFNIYHAVSYYKKDEKRGLYQFRCPPAAGVFFEDLKSLSVETNPSENDWSYAVLKAHARTGLLTVHDKDNNPHSDNGAGDVYSYLLGEILSGLQGKQGYGYRIGNVTHQIPMRGSDAPIIWKGTSLNYDSTTEAQALDNIMVSLSWGDIFKMAMYAQDAYLFVKARIDGTAPDEYLMFDIWLIPKTNNISSSPLDESTVTWKERYHIQDGSWVSEVIITCNNYIYSLGSNGEKNIDRNLSVSDPDLPQEDYDQKYYLAWATWDGTKYNYVKRYIHSDYIDPFYINLINGKNRWKGELLFDYDNHSKLIQLNNQLSFDGHIIQLVRLTGQSNSNAKIEGIEI